MLKNTHIATSTSLVLLFIVACFFMSALWGGNIFPIYPFLLLPILAVLPDADHPEGYLNVKFPIFKVISKIAGHRTWSHDLFTLLLVAIALYWGFGALFGYYDLPKEVLNEWILGYFKFFALSPNFLGIYIAMAGHTFGDFLTKGSVKFFYWAEFLDEKLKKIKILRYTLGLPFFILNKIQLFLNTIKGNIFPTTWSAFEKNIYAAFFNSVNFILILLLAFAFPITISLKNAFAVMADWDHLPLKIVLYLLIFFLVSIWYFFSLSFWKLKFYAKIAKNLVLFAIWMLVGLMAIYWVFTSIPALSNYAWAWVLAYMVLAVAVYRKTINVDFDYFNVIMNEMFLILVYLIIAGTGVYATTTTLKVKPIETLEKSKIEEIMHNTIPQKNEEKTKVKTDKTLENKKIPTKKKDKKTNKNTFQDRDFE